MGRVHAAPAVGQQATGPPSPPATGATAWRSTPAGRGARPAGTAPRQEGQGAADLAPQGDGDGVELAQHHRVEVDLDGGDVGGDAGVVGERGAQHEQAVAAAHVDRRHRDARPAEDAARQRVGVGDEALGLERGDDGGVDVLGEGGDLVPVAPGAVADDDHRPLGRATAARRPGPARLRAGRSRGRPPVPAGAWAWASATPGSSWTSSGKMRWATSRSTMACFMARAASSVAFSGRRTVWLHAATGLKAEARSTSWNVPGPMTCDLHLPGEGHDRHPVDLGVPQAGEQVGGARPGDGEAGRGPARRPWRSRRRRRRAAPSWRMPT